MSSRAFHGPSMLATTLLDNQSTTYVILKKRAEELMAELFAEDLDRNATGNDLRKLSINIDL